MSARRSQRRPPDAATEQQRADINPASDTGLYGWAHRGETPSTENTKLKLELSGEGDERLLQAGRTHGTGLHDLAESR